jgi:hypothetical protein
LADGAEPLTANELAEMFSLQDDESIEGLVDSINLNDAYMRGDAAAVRQLMSEIKRRRLNT